MRYLLKFVVLLTALVTMLPGAIAGPFEDGNAAYDRKDYEEAARLFGIAAESGNAEAQFWLGTMFLTGTFLEHNHARAASWYRKAAKQGHKRAQLWFDHLSDNGNAAPYDYDSISKLETGPFKDGCLAYEAGDYSGAAVWWRKAALANDVRAQFALGHLHEWYYFNELFSKSKAMNWHHKAAEQGHVDAQYRLGRIRRDLYGDDRKGTEWIRKAAESGHACAVVELARIARKVDQSESMRLYVRAAESAKCPSRRLEAISILGWRYHKGTGVPKDHVEALKWYEIYDRTPHLKGFEQPYVEEFKKVLLKEMEKGKVDEARRRASEWLAEHSQ